MATNYIHPHVAISKFAKTKTRVNVVDDTAPTLLAFITCNKGPENEFVKCYSYEEFTNTYGNTVFEKSGDNPEFLNIANWLNNGGAVLAYRMVGSDEKAASANLINGENTKSIFLAKYSGSYYNDFEVKISHNFVGKYLYITVINKLKEEVEGFAVTSANKDTIFLSSEYITLGTDGAAFIDTLLNSFKDKTDGFITLSTTEEFKNNISEYPVKSGDMVYYKSSQYYLMTLKGGKDQNTTDVYTLDGNKITYTEALLLAAIGDVGDDKALSVNYYDAESNKKTMAVKKGDGAFVLDANFDSIRMVKANLKKKLEYPVDVFFDGVYNIWVKKAIMANLATIRTDCHFFFNVYSGDLKASEMQLTSDGINAANTIFNVGSEEGDALYRNVSVYAQAMPITNAFTGKEQWVGPTYFLSFMAMDIDNRYGIQYPIAGLTRGTLQGVTKINDTPNADMKDELYSSKINYIEKDTRGLKFMSQLTRDAANNGIQYTALSYVNNSRTTERIARELERMGREYLFEFNDSTTLRNMQETLNAYLIGWVQNRTLSMAECFVRKNAYNDNAVDISMNIKFNGTIEIISIDIVID